MAISAVDVALWDLKARLIGVALVDLLPRKALAFSGLFAGFTVGATPLLYALALTTVEGGSQEFVAALVYPAGFIASRSPSGSSTTAWPPPTRFSPALFDGAVSFGSALGWLGTAMLGNLIGTCSSSP